MMGIIELNYTWWHFTSSHGSSSYNSGKIVTKDQRRIRKCQAVSTWHLQKRMSTFARLARRRKWGKSVRRWFSTWWKKWKTYKEKFALLISHSDETQLSLQSKKLTIAASSCITVYKVEFARLFSFFISQQAKENSLEGSFNGEPSTVEKKLTVEWKIWKFRRKKF